MLLDSAYLLLPTTTTTSSYCLLLLVLLPLLLRHPCAGRPHLSTCGSAAVRWACGASSRSARRIEREVYRVKRSTRATKSFGVRRTACGVGSPPPARDGRFGRCLRHYSPAWPLRPCGNFWSHDTTFPQGVRTLPSRP